MQNKGWDMNRIGGSALMRVAGCMALAIAPGALTTAAGAMAESKRLEVTDLGNLVRVSDPQISPDGKSIVFVLSRPNFKDARYDRSLVLVDVTSGAQRALTYDRRGVSSPRWSPSGDRLAFLDVATVKPEQAGTHTEAAGATPPSSEEASGSEQKYQVFVMPMNGGDAHRITHATQDVEQFAWSPDGAQIAYVTADDNPNRKEIARHNDAFQVGDTDYLTTEALMPSHLWLTSADGASARRLTSGKWSIPKGAPPSSPGSPLSWSPDGKSILIVQQSTPDWGDADQSVIAAVDAANGQIRKLTGHKALEGYPVYSPDGSAVAYWYPRDGDPNNGNELFVYEGHGDGVDLTRELDRDVVRAVWNRSGHSLLIAAHDGARVALWNQPRKGKATRVDLGDLDPAWSFWVEVTVAQDGGMALAGTTPTHPLEIYYVPPAGGQPHRLTDFNAEIASRNLGRSEELKWKGPNGMQEDGVVVYPPDFTPARKYPLVLVIHGGPQASSTLGFSGLAQVFAAHGYVVFEPNYRGSDNLGNAYQRAIVNDAGEGPGRDVMAGIDALKAKGFIDTSRMAVTGWSYGGYMTSWMIGHYHVWKAAVAGAAVTDLVHAYALSDFNVTERYALGGPPWSEKLARAYRDQSPITYASGISTPTLILSDTGDARVPISQSYLLYHAIKDRGGVPVQFIAYPVPGHFPGDPVRSTDVYRRWVEWVDHYMKAS